MSHAQAQPPRLRLPRFVHLGRPLTKQERLAAKFHHWDTLGRTTPVTADLLAGMFYTRYRTRRGMLPYSVVEDDLQHFQTFLSTYMQDDPTLAPWVIDALFNCKSFVEKGIRSAAFCNENILAKWYAVRHATELRMQCAVGEHAEFCVNQEKGYGVIRV